MTEKTRSILSHLGRYIYGGGAIVLGLIGLVWRDFATGWQHVAPTVPFHTLLAITTAMIEIAAGAALLWRQSARIGAGVLTAIYSIFTLLWAVQIFKTPGTYDPWGNFFEELSLVIAGLVLCASLAPRNCSCARCKHLMSRLYGLCVISFALEHIISFSFIVFWVPKWIPPGQVFWAATTTICFLLAAAAILSGIQAALAARLLTAMIVGFGMFVWAPRLFSAPHDHFTWSANGINLVMVAAAWVVADSLAAHTQHTSPAEP
jgi:uncharacterized membrane protein YphA (DoxX/SURF4 family)